jgi:hypothetical protein
VAPSPQHALAQQGFRPHARSDVGVAHRGNTRQTERAQHLSLA